MHDRAAATEPPRGEKCGCGHADGCEFAGLWGGGTVPQWRRRGIYRALVRYRADLAAERGYSHLTVDASDQSRPILERIGFECLAITTPYTWSPA